jgi:SAM-dependent methyltransferase
MTTTPASDDQARDVPAWTGDAVDYDVWFDTLWGHHAFAVESATVRRACGALAGRRALDAGCGTGRFSAALAGQHTAVVGVDPDPDMLRLARTRATGGCIRAAAEHLPFADGSFDLTLAVTVLEFVADPRAAVAELARVTCPGGRIIIGALNPHSPWGLANRCRLRAGVWCHARFLDPSDLRSLGAPHGRTSLGGTLYAPGDFPGLSRLGPLLEIAGQAAPAWGAFQVLVIDKDRHS